ncbi:MAG: tRNA (adenine(22)-N(1))-methyltransferase TrmK [Acetatifactor sp.]
MAPKRVFLSKRLQMLADMVTKGNRVVDIGCDHAYLSIYLVDCGISPCALAMDVRKGPLSAAEDHIRQSGFEVLVKTRLSDGLKEYLPGEAETLVCAGMGGPLMEKILTDSFEKVKTLKELILQPQSEIREFRTFLRQNGFSIVEERSELEDGKYYFAMKALPACGDEIFVSEQEDQDLFDAYGEYLLKTKDPVLLEFLEKQLAVCEELEQMLCSNLERTAQSEEKKADGNKRLKNRLSEVQGELSKIRRALEYFR